MLRTLGICSTLDDVIGSVQETSKVPLDVLLSCLRNFAVIFQWYLVGVSFIDIPGEFIDLPW